MVKRFVGFFWVVVFLLAAVHISEAQLRFGGGAQFGLAFSSFKKPAGDLYGTGLLFGAHGDADLNRYLTLRLSFDYATFGADQDKLKGIAAEAVVSAVQEWLGRALTAQERTNVMATVRSASGARVNAPSITIAGLGKIPTGSMVTPYGILGLGMTFLSFGDLSFDSQGIQGQNEQGQTVQIIPAGVSTTSLDSETKFGLEFGAGSEFRISRPFKLLFEVKYHMIFTTDGTSSYLPLVVGATFDF